MKAKFDLSKIIPFVGIGIITVASVFSLIGQDLTLNQVIAAIAMQLIFIAITSYYFSKFYDVTLTKRRYQLMFWIFIFIGYIPSLFLVDVSIYALPIMISAALITSLIHVRLGFVVNFVMLTLLLISTNMGMDMYFTYLVGGSFICVTIPMAKDRQQILYVTGGNIVFMALVHVVSYLLSYISFNDFNYLGLLFIGLNGLFVVIVSVGTEPMWEMLFRITSKTRLIELSNSSQPLLNKLMVEAPGTYHHSMIVANLAEKAAINIGANYHLARAGALYHDIGKTNRPEYFTENQNGHNPHADIAPDASAKYIIDHVEDGLELADEYKLPEDIKMIIREHQGDSIVSYFYQKAVDHSDGFDIDVDEFRYNGPKPQTVESALVMLADCVEASVKSLGEKERDLERISGNVDSVFSTVIAKKQLDDCPLTFKEIPVIKEAFVSVYNGMYHERVAYERS